MKLRIRPRRVAVALFALGSSVLGANLLVPSAHAEDPCTRAKVWTYHSNEGTQVHHNGCVGPSPWEPHTTVTVADEGDNIGPDGTPTGAGVELSVVP